ncbi:MAG: MarR family winged helix-turn-helix transcriptional regulator [Acidobacteriia bacterium]|nr:MarR family winged helix-turn-helix transcriptional regulator [Terriglobia bacterium]
MAHGVRGEACLVGLPCACANLRRAARAVTQLYDEGLRGSGLRTTQFTLLQVLAITRRITQGRLGDLLSLDSTTLTRTLRPLVGKGWVRSAAGKDRRERLYQLTPAGRRELERARPAWARAQERLRKVLGDTSFERLQSALLEVAEAARRA